MITDKEITKTGNYKLYQMDYALYQKLNKETIDRQNEEAEKHEHSDGRRKDFTTPLIHGHSE